MSRLGSPGGENRPTLLFAASCAHAKALHEQLQRFGVASAYVDAYTDSVERRLIERRFRAGEIKVACCVRTLTTGIDWPVSCIIDAAPTKSLMLHVQKIGRGLRVNRGTEDLLILDHAGNSLRNGLVTDIAIDRLDTTPAGKRQVGEKREKLPQPCSQCEVLHTGATCPGCGHERKAVSKVETVEGELVKVTGSIRKPGRSEKQQFYGMALWHAGSRDYSPGWAANKYREKFGVWPKGLSDLPMEPDQAFLNYEKSRRIAFDKRRQKEIA